MVDNGFNGSAHAAILGQSEKMHIGEEPGTQRPKTGTPQPPKPSNPKSHPKP